MSPTAGEASSQPPVSFGQPAGSDPSARKACRTSPLEPAITSAWPSPPTSAIAGELGICQPSITRGKASSQPPLEASQPPSRCWNGILALGLDWARARVESTTPPKYCSGPPVTVRPNAELAPSASTEGAEAFDEPPRPADWKWL